MSIVPSKPNWYSFSPCIFMNQFKHNDHKGGINRIKILYFFLDARVKLYSKQVQIS